MRLRAVMARASRSAPGRPAPSARGGRGTARTRAGAASRRGSRSSGRSGSMNGKRRQACTSAVCAANAAAPPRGRSPHEVGDELLVVLAQAGQVPRLVDHPLPCRRAPPSSARKESSCAGSSALTRASRSTCGVIHRPAAERAEARPRELRRQPVAQLAARLGHPQDEQQPAPVPAHRPAEAVDPPRAVAQQLGRGRREPHPRAPPDPLALQPALARAAHDRLARRRGREPEQLQRADQRLLPRAVGPLQQELPEHGEQRRARGGRADRAAS